MMKRWLAVLLVVVTAGGVGYFLGYARGSATRTSAEQAEIEEEFAQSMSGVVLEGGFTVDGSEHDARTNTERYTIERVEKLAGDLWLFHARIEFGETDVTLPVPVKLLWAGDTPVISLTDATLPGLGTYTARVVFYRDRYAGLWASPEHGGFQFGTVSPQNE